MPKKISEYPIVEGHYQSKPGNIILGIPAPVADAVDAVVQAADEIMNAVLHVLELQNGEPTKPDGEDASKLYKALAALKAVRDE
ncbi:MAG TPA: hypothetical protein VMV86_00375 [Methanosarcinales archaeon]|nr:hypothetical protein [Methanosarcinales archaeon]